MPSYPVPDNEVQRLQAVAALAFAADTPDPALDALVRVAHAAAGRIRHLAILQVIARAGKERVVAAVVVMQMRQDDGADLVRLQAVTGKLLGQRHAARQAMRA